MAQPYNMYNKVKHFCKIAVSDSLSMEQFSEILVI